MGWWRHAYGSNLGTVDCAYVINGEKLMAWDGLQRKEWCQDCSDCAGTEKDKNECFHDHQYPDILIYLCDELGLLPSAMFALARLIWHGKIT